MRFQNFGNFFKILMIQKNNLYSLGLHKAAAFNLGSSQVFIFEAYLLHQGIGLTILNNIQYLYIERDNLLVINAL